MEPAQLAPPSEEHDIIYRYMIYVHIYTCVHIYVNNICVGRCLDLDCLCMYVCMHAYVHMYVYVFEGVIGPVIFLSCSAFSGSVGEHVQCFLQRTL